MAKRYGINQKTVAKWRERASVADLPTGPRDPRSTVLSPEEEAVSALQPTIPHLTRSSLHRCLQRHGISRLPDVKGDKPAKKKFKSHPIGYFHIDVAEVRTEQGKLHMFEAAPSTAVRSLPLMILTNCRIRVVRYEQIVDLYSRQRRHLKISHFYFVVISVSDVGKADFRSCA